MAATAAAWRTSKVFRGKISRDEISGPSFLGHSNTLIQICDMYMLRCLIVLFQTCIYEFFPDSRTASSHSDALLQSLTKEVPHGKSRFLFGDLDQVPG